MADELRSVHATAGSPHHRTTHAALARIRAAACGASLYGQAQTAHGLTPAFPYLDRAVVEACLACRPWEATDPHHPKPLLLAALAPLTSPGLMTRRDKGHYTAELYTGWRRHRRHLTDLLDAPVLADLGLIDPGQLRTAARTFLDSGLPPALLTDTLALELWLQAQPPAHTGGGENA
ncbi:asparagine synthase-related protein [Candidatus Protofrankia californiensis]|uniref:asparagine synthase-related protein n=1 Tax=Candidatus Protofrankia californiensis TaxID=1839754 RepID=UPI001041322D|nr:asparagine synthase-related protein [Candidatus Protofrankia californiensis]